jgi:hypothetical protein
MDARYRIVLVDLRRRVTMSFGIPGPLPARKPPDPLRAYLAALGIVEAH